MAVAALPLPPAPCFSGLARQYSDEDPDEATMKRIILFIATNLAVVLVLSIVLRLFGFDRALAAQGFQYGQLLVYSLVVGFTGAIISLLMFKLNDKSTTGARVIDAPANDAEAWLVETVRKLATAAGV